MVFGGDLIKIMDTPHIFPIGFLGESFKVINYKQQAFRRSMISIYKTALYKGEC
jgi:hypothetical protein